SARQFEFINIIILYTSPKEILFGNFNEYQFGNATNAALTIYLSLGILGLISTYYLYAKRLTKASELSKTRDSRVALACILSFFIQSSAESFMFTGAFPGVIFIYIYTLFLPTSKRGY
ncbi:MAG: hypothetical protein ACOWWR_18760, partial [Eubacteriales bacterium]